MRNRLIRLYPFATLLLGIFLAQILASIHVYLSNINLYDSMVAIKNAGYLPVPNSLIMGQLHNVGPAFWGGLFLTFSVGTGISFLSLSLAWIWDRIFHRKILILYLFLLLLAVCLAGDLIMDHAHYLTLDHPLSFSEPKLGKKSVELVKDNLQPYRQLKCRNVRALLQLRPSL